ncbi:MAG: Delta-1-pyrroline-5-carboxylate dehydrogenase, partial [uncultured Gemmatimonadetes bacterium]
EQRHESSRAAQRDGAVVCPRERRARRAQGRAGPDGRGRDRDSAHHRRARGAHRQHRAAGDAARPRARPRHLSQGRRGRGAPGREGLRGSPARVDALALGGPPRRLPARGGAAGHALPPRAQRRHHARPEQDGVPGRDRQRLRADRLLAL